METITKQQFVSAVELVEFYPNALEIIKKYLEQLNYDSQIKTRLSVKDWITANGRDASPRLLKALNTKDANGNPFFTDIYKITANDFLSIPKVGRGTWFEFRDFLQKK
jgi:hypothetical protein